MIRFTKIAASAAVIIALAAPHARGAGQQVGNGGHIVAGECYAPGVSVYQLLDFYEGTRLRGWTFDLGPAGTSLEDKVEVALHRLDRLDPARATRYRAWLATFQQEMSVLPAGIRLNDIQDTGTYEIPSGCAKHQLAKQVAPQNPEDKRYFIDSINWNAIDDDNKAGLILHEIVYRDALQRGHTNSSLVRYVVGLLASPYADTLTPDEFRLRMSSHFMTAYYWTNSGDYYEAYYPDLQMSKADAAAYCDALPGVSHLTYGYFWSSYWSSFVLGPIGRQIFGLDGRGSNAVWTSSGLLDITENGNTQADSQADRTLQHSVICETIGTPF